MDKFLLSADSTCDLSQSFIKQNNIFVASLSFVIEKDGDVAEYLDKFDSDTQYVEFYDVLKNSGIARTSMLNYESNYAHFLALAKMGAKEVLHFSLSSGLSPTVEVAVKAGNDVKTLYPEFNLTVIDSLTATIGLGIQVEMALKMRNEGKTAKEVYDFIMPIRNNIQHFIIADDLLYLRRGGRISTVSAMVGAMLDIKPIISFNEIGKLVVIEKCRRMRKAFSTVIEKVKKMPPVQEHHMTVVHTNAEEEAKTFATMIENELNIKPDVRFVGPVIGSHLGPGSVSLCYLSTAKRNEF